MYIHHHHYVYTSSSPIYIIIIIIIITIIIFMQAKVIHKRSKRKDLYAVLGRCQEATVYVLVS